MKDITPRLLLKRIARQTHGQRVLTIIRKPPHPVDGKQRVIVWCNACSITFLEDQSTEKLIGMESIDFPGNFFKKFKQPTKALKWIKNNKLLKPIMSQKNLKERLTPDYSSAPVKLTVAEQKKEETRLRIEELKRKSELR